MMAFPRFDLLESSYAVALMADVTPAWREIYADILDQLLARHTTWWAAIDWLTMLGDDPNRTRYPEWYRLLIPADHWGRYNVPGRSPRLPDRVVTGRRSQKALFPLTGASAAL